MFTLDSNVIYYKYFDCYDARIEIQLRVYASLSIANCVLTYETSVKPKFTTDAIDIYKPSFKKQRVITDEVIFVASSL